MIHVDFINARRLRISSEGRSMFSLCVMMENDTAVKITSHFFHDDGDQCSKCSLYLSLALANKLIRRSSPDSEWYTVRRMRKDKRHRQQSLMKALRRLLAAQ